MTASNQNLLDSLFHALAAAPGRSLLLLDYDGTLSGFRVDRFQARPWAGVRELLARIQADGRTRMAIVTGRPPEEIQPMLQLPTPLEVWGLHGAERLTPDGRRQLEALPADSRRQLDQIRVELQRDPLGGLYEDKANAAVLHWRGLSAQRASQVRERALARLEPLAHLEGLRLLPFEGGVELRGGREKGGAIQAILDEEATAGASAAISPVVYMGDDLTDEAAFRAVNASTRPHLSVLVRSQPRQTGAALWLRPPAELRQFLARWAATLEAC